MYDTKYKNDLIILEFILLNYLQKILLKNLRII